ncbi:prepilin-type N-terminal cleavage/methylation domain-containing protein [Candidatus Oleimmundimicrobium sp.]|uniref:type IV pilus modification PilV family protein n=1 Tax=Candidatus Oleimmundimicrobium sp. TaxID=3060597 RepID=UPI00271D7802|nr:prepilin-type N-terminal cleavage/methylation domain-containing protein [Candidatus Oleimmundimicrobium sp.]MDO8886437.1 prepilin-type N-terminal cleavage/methylation domain-containing protein [Candidatus Oleimmundimicrobium sp.]
MKFFSKDERGFTLAEIMIAMTILVIGLIPIFVMFSEGIGLTARSTELSLAINSARDKMEEIRNITHNSITIGTWPDEEVVIGNRTFVKRVTVDNSDVAGAGGNLKKIIVEVFWEHENTTESTSLVTYRCNKLEE